MNRPSDFDKTTFVSNLGYYRNIDKVYPKDSNYSFKKVRFKLLNKAAKFLTSNKEYKEKILVCFHVDNNDDGYEELSYCCQEAVDDGCNYCPECGEDLRDFKDRGFQGEFYDSFSDLRMLGYHIVDEEDFEKKYIELSDLPEDYFDEYSVWSNTYMEDELFKKCRAELEKEGIILE